MVLDTISADASLYQLPVWNIASINALNKYYIYLYSAFVFTGVYAYSELMDRSPYAIVWELIKNVFGITIIYNQGDWFGSSQYSNAFSYILIAYFILSTIVTGWFVYKHYREDNHPEISFNQV